MTCFQTAAVEWHCIQFNRKITAVGKYKDYLYISKTTAKPEMTEWTTTQSEWSSSSSPKYSPVYVTNLKEASNGTTGAKTEATSTNTIGAAVQFGGD